MLVSDAPEEERKRIVREAREQAAFYTDADWRYVESGSVKELYELAESVGQADLLCLDVTMRQGVEAAEKLRMTYPHAYMILVADLSISPVKYLRPSVRAESLMLKPLYDEQICQVLGEAVRLYAGRMEKPDTEDFFVVENRGSRELVEYERILFFESREKKVYLSTETEEYGFYDTLDSLEKRLNEAFIRTHRSFLVNKRKIEKVELAASQAVLTDGTRIPLSRTCKPAVRTYLESRKGGIHR